MRDLLDKVVPASKIAADLTHVLASSAYIVELNGSSIRVPVDAPLHVVARSAHSYEYAMGFGDHYRALVAVGGVKGVSHGVPQAGICFATLWYSAEAVVSTVDFSSEAP